MSLQLLLLFFGLLFYSSAFAVTYVPKLELVNAIKGDPAILTDQYQIQFDDRGQICLSAFRNGLICYEGSALTRLHDFSVGLISQTVNGQQKLFFSDAFNLFSLINGKVTLEVDSSNFEYAKGEFIKSLYSTGYKSSFYILTTRAVYIFQDGSVSKLISLNEYDVPAFVRKSVADESIEVATQKGLKVYDFNGKLLDTQYRGFRVFYMIDDYVLTEKGLFYKQKLLSEGSFYSAAKTRTGNLLVVGNMGICSVDMTTAVCPNFSDDIVKSIYFDKFDNIWAITNNGFKQATTSHFQHIDNRYGLNDNQVKALKSYDGKVYVGTSKGVNVYDSTDKIVRLLDNTQDLQVRDLLFIHDDLWIASINKGLVIYNIHSKSVREVDSLNTGRIVSLVHKEDLIWAASNDNGISTYTADGDVIDRGLHPGIKKVSRLIVCNDSMFVASKRKGLIKLDKNKGLLSEGDTRALNVACINDELVTANDQHVYRVSTDNREIQSAPISSALASIFYFDNVIWLLQENGLAKFADSEQVLDGIRMPHLYRDISVLHDRHLFLGSSKGLVILDLDNYGGKENDPVLMSSITSSNLDGANYLTIDIYSENLLSQKYFDFFYSYNKNGPFAPLIKGSLPLYKEPMSNSLYFKGIDSSKNQAKLISVDLNHYLTLHENVAMNMPTLNTTFSYAFYGLFICICATVVYIIFNLAAGRISVSNKELRNSKPSNNGASAYENFLKIRNIVITNPVSYGDAGYDLRACILLLEKNREIYLVKTLVDVTKMRESNLRESVQLVFGLSLKDFLKYCIRYNQESSLILPQPS